MAIYGADTTSYKLTGKILRANNKLFVCRYLSNHHTGKDGTPNWKDLRAEELPEKKAAGVRIVCNWELMADPPNSRAVGQSHAEMALAEMAELGCPDWAVIYYSIDTPAHAHDYDDYAHGWADRVHPDRLGCYGDGALFRQLKADGLIRLAWQSMSRGYPGNHPPGDITKWDHSGADVVQYRSSTIGGYDADFDYAVSADYGGWFQGEEDPNMALSDADKKWIQHEMDARIPKTATAVWDSQIANGVVPKNMQPAGAILTNLHGRAYQTWLTLGQPAVVYPTPAKPAVSPLAQETADAVKKQA